MKYSNKKLAHSFKSKTFFALKLVQRSILRLNSVFKFC